MSWIHLLWYCLAIAAPFIYWNGDAEWILIFGNVAKVFSLLVCGLSLTITQSEYSTEDTPQKAWTNLAVGMWLWFFAQIIFAYYKLVLRQSPYPSIADIFFAIGYLPLIIGVVFLIKDFKSTGLPMGTRSSYVIQTIVLLILYGIIFATLMWPLIVSKDPIGAKFLNVGYPTCDFIMVSLTSVLVRISWGLRGGSLARSWLLLCIGFTLLGLTDITFAYRADPRLDVLFFSSYFLIALAGVYQVRMVRQ
ncbi:MAG TPA: hypothetical protein VLR94_10020 [Acidobacteriota bacterium]|nr:hypothetical protein [Acidobacteriota bacterium]